jgi:hypothetical protein
MKNIILKLLLSLFIIGGVAACKKEVYPEELKLLVVNSFTQKPIPNAQVTLYKVWRHPIKIADNAKRNAWFPDYGRKHMQEIQTGTTNKSGLVSFSQDHKKYLYVIPAVNADGYQSMSFDTLNKLDKSKAKDAIYTLAIRPMVKTTFIFKSRFPGLDNDSIVFSADGQKKVMRGAYIDDKLDIYSSNSIDPYVKVWYAGTLYKGGKKKVFCSYVSSFPNVVNEFPINVDY